MFDFILEITIVICIGGILYIFSRTLPRIGNEIEEKGEKRISTHLILGYLEKIDEWIKVILEKTLRRVKVLILKFDNVVSEKLDRFKKEPRKEKEFELSSEEDEEVKITPEREEE